MALMNKKLMDMFRKHSPSDDERNALDAQIEAIVSQWERSGDEVTGGGFIPPVGPAWAARGGAMALGMRAAGNEKKRALADIVKLGAWAAERMVITASMKKAKTMMRKDKEPADSVSEVLSAPPDAQQPMGRIRPTSRARPSR